MTGGAGATRNEDGPRGTDELRAAGNTAARAPGAQDASSEQSSALISAGTLAAKRLRTRIPVPEDREWPGFFAPVAESMEATLKLIAAAGNAQDPAATGPALADARMWLTENARLVRTALQHVDSALPNISLLPFSCPEGAAAEPRVVALGAAYCGASDGAWNIALFSEFVTAFQQTTPLLLKETWSLPVGVQIALLRALAPAATAVADGSATEAQAQEVSRIMLSLLGMSVAVWPKLLQPLIAFEPTLERDATYRTMDGETRDRYRGVIAHLARRSDVDEVAVARAALDLASTQPPVTPMTDLRRHARMSHIGYYLIDKGREELELRVGYHPLRGERTTRWLERHSADFYIGSVQLLALLIIALLMLRLVSYQGALVGLMIAFVVSVLPASQGAVEIMNHIVAALFPAAALPKLNFCAGIPADYTTLVAVPVLLLDEKQVRDLVNDLEVRYLANTDANLHYALLTDLPDSLEQPAERDSDPLVELARQLIEETEARHVGSGGGGFLLLHRHRVYNAREGAWIGWERKRGKLLDLNQLLRGTNDSFPIKAGRIGVLHQIRFVLTLDSDTQLPRDSAHRLVGTMAHPLNRARVDPELRIVTEGYGILQPRVGISIHSAARSRMAALYSGETGLDIYSRAASDMYQDLFGEAIFTGKGLYEVDVLQEVLLHRFPRNALLSHDLIEGSYARAGLVSDVEVIDDYPSHLSAWSRRKHRWVRGDWQVAQWMLPNVPDENNRKKPNPISVISRWKIFDNLRRSLYEPAILLMFLAGWFGLPGGPLYWTAAALLIIFFPVYVQLGASLWRAGIAPQPGAVVDAMEGFYKGLATLAIQVAFLPQQALLTIDAIVRTLFRRFVSGKRLLQWETAAQAELGASRRNPVDIYFDLTPLLCLMTGLLLLLLQRYALPFAVPFLLVWALGRPLTAWLNRPVADHEHSISAAEQRMLRDIALRTWRYFEQFSNLTNSWLVPDNVEEEQLVIADRVSPTNIGLLLNARQAALELGFITLPEFVRLTSQTLSTMERMERSHGHLLNWYDTATLAPMTPRIVSSVDSGNLLASLWTLRQHCMELIDSPMVTLRLAENLAGTQSAKRPGMQAGSAEVETYIRTAIGNAQQQHVTASAHNGPQSLSDDEARERRAALRDMLASYRPLLLEEYAALRNVVARDIPMQLSPRQLPDFQARIRAALEPLIATGRVENAVMAETVRVALTAASENIRVLVRDLEELAARAEALAAAMDFSMLLSPSRGLLSIAYNVEKDSLHDACYDLLASEARTACFLAIAKKDIPQSAWFRLGRGHVFASGIAVLTSWTGTMFEYLMPALWMSSFRGSMLARTEEAVVRIQIQHVRAERVPWGISESGFATRNSSGHYGYHAFGLKEIAASPNATDGGPVIAPYAACLALPHAPAASVANLVQMQKNGWLGLFGFYEAADYAPDTSDRTRPAIRKSAHGHPELVRSWMAHHQGMSLLALCNTLAGGAVQRWFHADRRVQATELLLHERPMRTSSLAAVRAQKAA